MSAEAFAQLKEDIRKNGLIEPIWTVNNQIIDGRHRLMACRELDIEPTFREYTGTIDLETFVYSINVARRQMTRQERTWFVKRLLKAHPGKSDRVIAGLAGVERTTVLKIRKEGGEFSPPERIGTNGKTYKVPVTHRTASLISHADFESRKCLRFLMDLHPHQLTDSADFIYQLEAQVARLKGLLDITKTG